MSTADSRSKARLVIEPETQRMLDGYDAQLSYAHEILSSIRAAFKHAGYISAADIRWLHAKIDSALKGKDAL